MYEMFVIVQVNEIDKTCIFPLFAIFYKKSDPSFFQTKCLKASQQSVNGVNLQVGRL